MADTAAASSRNVVVPDGPKIEENLPLPTRATTKGVPRHSRSSRTASGIRGWNE